MSPLGRQAQPQNNQSHHLKVLLFNVWQLPGFLTDGASAQRARAAARLIKSSGADVVCLNEAFFRADETLSGIKHTHPYRAHLQGRAGWFTPLGSGLHVASRLPIATQGGVFFRARSGADRLASKGVLHCVLDLDDGKVSLLDLFVTHMQAGCSPAEQAARRAQAAEAGAFVRQARTLGRPALLAGDLNMSPCTSASPHCATDDDARQRCEAYGEMCRVGRVCDAVAAAHFPEHEICRFAVGEGEDGGKIRVRSVRYLGRRCPETGEVASDTDAVLAEVEVFGGGRGS
jgi:endonuclease/exonuclease/phosphatase family metal-dependent hydrolase